ncbi:hypothetical protein LDFHOB_13330 [Candidatus Electronema aureum]
MAAVAELLFAAAVARQAAHGRLLPVLGRIVVLGGDVDALQHIHVFGPHFLRRRMALAVREADTLEHVFGQVRILGRSRADIANQIVVPDGEGDQKNEDRQSRNDFAAIVH